MLLSMSLYKINLRCYLLSISTETCLIYESVATFGSDKKMMQCNGTN